MKHQGPELGEQQKRRESKQSNSLNASVSNLVSFGGGYFPQLSLSNQQHFRMETTRTVGFKCNTQHNSNLTSTARVANRAEGIQANLEA